MYQYLNNRNVRNQLREHCEDKVFRLQKKLKPYFSFKFELIGSGASRLMTYNGKDNSVDLDYNLILQSDKRNLFGKPERIKRLFMDALREIYGSNAKVEDSTQVITCKVGRLCGYDFSFDAAILANREKAGLCKIVDDKKDGKQTYVWNKVKGSEYFAEKFRLLKEMHYWEEIKERYLKKKNDNLSKHRDISSHSVLIETVNEIMHEKGIKL